MTTDVKSMCSVSGGLEEEYCFTLTVTVAREMALRRNQERPCRARMGSAESERVVFYLRRGGVSSGALPAGMREGGMQAWRGGGGGGGRDRRGGKGCDELRSG